MEEDPVQVHASPSDGSVPFELATPQQWRTRALMAALSTLTPDRRARLMARRADGTLQGLDDTVASDQAVRNVLWEECIILHKSAAGWHQTSWMLPTDNPADYYIHRAAALELADLDDHARGLPTLWLSLLGGSPSVVHAIAQRVGQAAASFATQDLPPEESRKWLELLAEDDIKGALEMRQRDRYPKQIPPTITQAWRLALEDLKAHDAPHQLRAVLLGLATLRALWETMDPAERAVLASGSLSTLTEAMNAAGVIPFGSPRDAAAAMRVAVWVCELTPREQNPEFIREGF